MFDFLLQKDKQILIYLNNLGNEQWDPFWLFITNQLNWAPLFLLIIFLIFKKFGWKKGGFIFLFTILLVAFSDQFTNVIRGIFERLRPNNDVSINHLLRTLITPQSYSFTSGHATTSMTFSVFIYFLFKDKYKYIKFIFIFPIFFAYIGAILGFYAFKLQHFLSKKMFTT